MFSIGFPNCVALLGTNLSDDQLEILCSSRKRIVIFLDGDAAGREATINVAKKLLLKEIDCEIVSSSYVGDPDELCRVEKEFVLKLLSKRKNPFVFILNFFYQKFGVKENPQRSRFFIEEVSKIFKSFKPSAKEFLIKKISDLVNWREKDVENYFVR
jgi:DNA primase